MTAIHQTWKLYQGTQRYFGEKKRKRKKNIYSYICLLGTIGWLMNIFQMMIFFCHFWCLLNVTVKIEVTKENVLWRREKMTCFHHKTKWRKHPYHLLGFSYKYELFYLVSGQEDGHRSLLLEVGFRSSEICSLMQNLMLTDLLEENMKFLSLSAQRGKRLDSLS